MISPTEYQLEHWLAWACLVGYWLAVGVACWVNVQKTKRVCAGLFQVQCTLREGVDL